MSHVNRYIFFNYIFKGLIFEHVKKLGEAKLTYIIFILKKQLVFSVCFIHGNGTWISDYLVSI